MSTCLQDNIKEVQRIHAYFIYIENEHTSYNSG